MLKLIGLSVPLLVLGGVAYAQEAPANVSAQEAQANVSAQEAQALEAIIETAGPAGSEGASAGHPGDAGHAADPAGHAAGPEPSLAELDLDAVNSAAFSEGAEALKGAQPLVLKAQVLLDRAGTSPGVVDAYWGDNVAKAVSAFQEREGLAVTGRLDAETFAALEGSDPAPVLVSYQITAEDVAGPFIEIPSDYAEMAKLPGLYFSGPMEALGERFHMDTDLLQALNPGAAFAAGETIVVADVGKPVEGDRIVTEIRADKRTSQVFAYNAEGRLVTAYPATIGSEATPSPSGTHKVESVAIDPVYYYNPENFVQGDNTEKLELPPGPNGPVGSVWIDLSKPSYGIHGTPEPSKIDKTYSNGCVRLTNWDADELAHLVKTGATVTFVE